MILKSHIERQSYGQDKLVPPARQPDRPPAEIRQSNKHFFPSENLVKKGPTPLPTMCNKSRRESLQSISSNPIVVLSIPDPELKLSSSSNNSSSSSIVSFSPTSKSSDLTAMFGTETFSSFTKMGP
ncbi:hypothetical protein DPMN_066553 [Dreissena polymorpha]|uniref:Uncharacterized protein n=1 Tax=Dreissena polymorpha TaxID=45954 RepID=A0A9D3YXK7_DREPO|nr:hypothetical protein DPMN_066553 [Dreissena polymorpha]